MGQPKVMDIYVQFMDAVRRVESKNSRWVTDESFAKCDKFRINFESHIE